VTGRAKKTILWTCVLILIVLFLVRRFAKHNFEERPTHVTVDGGTTPVFVLSGSGALSTFSVYVVSPPDFTMGRTVRDLSDDSFFAEPPLWRIEAQPDLMHGRRVEDIRRLTYGVVPSGYKQEIPANGLTPGGIIPGKQYYFHCETTNAPTASGGFQVSDGKAASMALGLPCLKERDGKEITVPCPKYR